MKKETVKIVLSNSKRHHVEADNERLREALRTIHELCTSSKPSEELRTVAKIARGALVSAATEGEKP